MHSYKLTERKKLCIETKPQFYSICATEKPVLQ